MTQSLESWLADWLEHERKKERGST